MIEELGASGITLAVVAVLRSTLGLSARASVIWAGVVSVAVTGVVALALGTFPAWNTLPLQALQNWLVSMGGWSGTKGLLGK